MKKIKTILLWLIPMFLISSCSTYNNLVPDWAEICSKPQNTKEAAWYKPCNYKNPEFKKIFKDK